MTDLALRLLLQLASEPGQQLTIADVARFHAVSEAHLMKITHRLGMGGWLETLRGRGGGIRLAMPADRIRLGDVVRSIEPDFQLVECRGPDSQCRLTNHCSLAGVLDDALGAFMARLDAVTLADLVRPPARPAVVALPTGRPGRRSQPS